VLSTCSLRFARGVVRIVVVGDFVPLVGDFVSLVGDVVHHYCLRYARGVVRIVAVGDFVHHWLVI